MEMTKTNNEDTTTGQNEETQEPLLGDRSVQPIIVKSEKVDMEFVKPKRVSDAHDVCAEVMGEWGPWQRRTVSIIYLTKMPAAWFMACIIFTAPQPWYGEYECDLSRYYQTSSGNVSYSYPTKMVANGSLINDYCVLEEKLYNEETDNYEFKRRIECEYFNYNIDPFTTLTTQFDLACSRNILVAITQVFHLFGVLVGGIVATYLMEILSPRRVMMLGMILQIPIGIATGYAPYFWLHVFSRWTVAGCAAMIFTPCAVIMSDIVGGRYKLIASANFENSWSIAVILLAAIGYFCKTWTQIYIVISVPTFLLMFLWIWIPDSPRWHLERGDVESTKSILETAFKMNKNSAELPYNFDDLLKAQAVFLINKRSNEKKSSFIQLLKLKKAPLVVFLVMLGWSFTLTIYYGTLLNIRSFGRTTLIENTAIAGFSEVMGTVIGFCILFFLKNKWTWVGMFAAFTGMINCAIWLLNTHLDGSHYLTDLLAISMLNKIGISAMLCVLTTCTAELVPAVHKKRINFGATVVGRTLFMTAPLIGFLAKYGDGVSLTFFGVMTSIAGIGTALLSPIQIENESDDGKL